MSLFRIILVRPNIGTQTLQSAIAGAQTKKMSAAKKNSEETPLISLKEAKRFMKDCFVAVGAPEKHAEMQADLLITADHRGIFSHGMNRLHLYINEIQNKLCDAKAVPKILKDMPATAWVSGQNGLGAVVGNFCMDLAIKKAKEVGVGWVCAKESNHYGIGGYYTIKATQQGLIGLDFTNTSPMMCPPGAKKAALGTNPISIAAPSKDKNDSFVMDMATTSVAVGKIEILKRKGEPIPTGWVLDASGKSTTDTKIAMDTKLLMPLGGSEGYKGFALGMVVDIFSGILSGAAYGPNVRKWGGGDKRLANLGQCFGAINPACFAPGFGDRLRDLMCTIRNFEPVDPAKPVLIAGDIERKHMHSVDCAGGVRYVKDQMKTCAELAEKLCVKPLKSC